MKADSKWGNSFYDALSNDFKKVFPTSNGFSPRNLLYMKQFYSLFPIDEVTPQVGAQIMPQVGAQIMPQVGAQIFMMPWNHIKLIIDKCGKNQNKAIFYVNTCLKNNWSRAILMNQISLNLYERQAITNFEYTTLWCDINIRGSNVMRNYEIVEFVDDEFEIDVRTDKGNDTVWLNTDQISK